MSDENKVLDSYLEAQLTSMERTAETLAQTMRSYYDALIKQGFTERQAIELCREFHYVLFQLGRS